MKAMREDWFEHQSDLDPDRLVFLDETAATNKMARRYGRTPRGQRCQIAVPHGHDKTTTLPVALRATGLIAKTVFNGATNGMRFRAYVTDTLAPALKPGNTVILVNLNAHKVISVREAIEAVGVRVLYLPPYSPGLIPADKLLPSSRPSFVVRQSELSQISGVRSGRPSTALSQSSAATTSSSDTMTT
jgi:hypothetical protein